MKKKILKRAAAAFLLCLYPAAIIVFAWSHVLKSDLKGGRNGQLDAYRHALASAAVAYTLGQWAVHFTTYVFESGGKASNLMDAQNNRIGAKIGSQVQTFSDIEPCVRQAVQHGQASATDPSQITWLPTSQWRDSKFW